MSKDGKIFIRLANLTIVMLPRSLSSFIVAGGTVCDHLCGRGERHWHVPYVTSGVLSTWTCGRLPRECLVLPHEPGSGRHEKERRGMNSAANVFSAQLGLITRGRIDTIIKIITVMIITDVWAPDLDSPSYRSRNGTGDGKYMYPTVHNAELIRGFHLLTGLISDDDDEEHGEWATRSEIGDASLTVRLWNSLMRCSAFRASDSSSSAGTCARKGTPEMNLSFPLPQLDGHHLHGLIVSLSLPLACFITFANPFATALVPSPSFKAVPLFAVTPSFRPHLLSPSHPRVFSTSRHVLLDTGLDDRYAKSTPSIPF
nr:hypothetical protein CFP56_48798 [Quercus suber]